MPVLLAPDIDRSLNCKMIYAYSSTERSATPYQLLRPIKVQANKFQPLKVSLSNIASMHIAGLLRDLSLCFRTVKYLIYHGVEKGAVFSGINSRLLIPASHTGVVNDTFF